MCIEDGNSLKEPWEKYQRRLISQLVKEIPECSREKLAELIKARAGLLGCKNKEALETALKQLSK